MKTLTVLLLTAALLLAGCAERDYAPGAAEQMRALETYPMSADAPFDDPDWAFWF
jgi:hypothetical protein